MKKGLLLSLTALILSVSLFAETTKTIEIKNALDASIYYLYLSPSDEREWGEDRLGDDLFHVETSLEIEITYDESRPMYDLMAEDEMEKTYRIEELNLNQLDSLVITAEDFLPVGGRNPQFRDVTFSNETGEDIYYLYVSSRDSMYWGEDLLGDDVLDDGRAITITLPIDADYPDNDVLAESESASSYELMDLNLLERDYIYITQDDMSESGEEDWDYDEFDDSYDNDEYFRGYKDGFREAWKEAYSQGYQDALEQN